MVPLLIANNDKGDDVKRPLETVQATRTDTTGTSMSNIAAFPDQTPLERASENAEQFPDIADREREPDGSLAEGVRFAHSETIETFGVLDYRGCDGVLFAQPGQCRHTDRPMPREWPE